MRQFRPFPRFIFIYFSRYLGLLLSAHSHWRRPSFLIMIRNMFFLVFRWFLLHLLLKLPRLCMSVSVSFDVRCPFVESPTIIFVSFCFIFWETETLYVLRPSHSDWNCWITRRGGTETARVTCSVPEATQCVRFCMSFHPSDPILCTFDPFHFAIVRVCHYVICDPTPYLMCPSLTMYVALHSLQYRSA